MLFHNTGLAEKPLRAFRLMADGSTLFFFMNSTREDFSDGFHLGKIAFEHGLESVVGCSMFLELQLFV